MKIDKQKQEVYDFDILYQNKLFENIYELIEKQEDEISKIESLGFSGLYNSGITLNNKIIELSWDFKHVGLSMFPKIHTGNNNKENTTLKESFIGSALLYDLISVLKEENEKLVDFNYKINDIIDRKMEKFIVPENLSLRKKILKEIEIFFMMFRDETLYFTEEDIDTLMFSLYEYEELDRYMFNYNLKDNVINSITKELRRREYSKDEAKKIVDEQIIPDLEKLELNMLIPKLKEEIEIEYKKIKITGQDEFQDKNSEKKDMDNKFINDTIKVSDEVLDEIDMIIQDIDQRHETEDWTATNRESEEER